MKLLLMLLAVNAGAIQIERTPVLRFDLSGLQKGMFIDSIGQLARKIKLSDNGIDEFAMTSIVQAIKPIVSDRIVSFDDSPQKASQIMIARFIRKEPYLAYVRWVPEDDLFEIQSGTVSTAIKVSKEAHLMTPHQVITIRRLTEKLKNKPLPKLLRALGWVGQK